MVAYVIFTREEPVKDQAALENYSKINREQAKNPDLTPLVVYGKIEALECEPPDGVVMLQFPTLVQAKQWYFSDEYQKAIPLRNQAARYRAFIVEGL